MPTVVRSFSKINLGLAIGPLRPDGFHALTTLYQTLEAHDLVTVEARPAAETSISITTTDRRVPADARNTAWKAVKAFLDASRLDAEVLVHIDKRLPVQGGLGAGSANAIAAIIGLGLELKQGGATGPRTMGYVEQIGSDVPLFLVGGAVLGQGRGEQVYAMPDLPATHCVVALPEIGVSTPQAFRDWDTLQETGHGADPSASALTETGSSDRLMELSRLYAAVLGQPHSSGVSAMSGGLAGNPLLALVRTGIENDFEKVVFPKYPQLGEIKRVLAASDDPERAALYASLSGSGSAVFGLYGTTEAAEAAVLRLEERGIRSLLTKTLPREKYWRTMVVE